MKIENQVCTLEQGKKLKDLGVYQGVALFGLPYWFIGESLPVLAINTYTNGTNIELFKTHAKDFIRAFTVAELGAMLPRNFASFNCGYDIWRVANTFNYANGHDIFLEQPVYTGTSKTFINIHGNNEAQVRAEVLIFLIEKGRITVSEINQRLQAS